MLYNCYNTDVFSRWLIFFKIPTFFETLAEIWLICSFHCSFSSIGLYTPRSLAFSTRSIVFPSIWMVNELISCCLHLDYGENKMQLVFLIFKDNLFDLNHSDSLSSSTLLILCKIFRSLWRKKMLVSSANKIKWRNLLALTMSFI